MAKEKRVYECQSCGFINAKWLGKCPQCNEWDSFLELSKEQEASLKKISTVSSKREKSISLVDIKEDNITRYSSGNIDLDLVLGGGVVAGSLVLIGGAPGVGKSTLLLMVAANISKQNKKVLYVSGEESASQIKLRASRLGAIPKNVYLLAEINLDNIMVELLENSYDFLVIDSIQTMYSPKISSAPGSVSQVREVTFDLMRYAKSSGTPTFIIGHITKEGSIAGPRVLEHMVDTVLYFEGDSSKELRILRGFKNRFGSTSEIGIFEMNQYGLTSLKEITRLSRQKKISGIASTVIMEGSRPIIVEVESLVTTSYLPSPKRSSTGFELNRLNMLLALLEKKLEIPLNQYDVFVNISSGIKVNEPAADLAIIAAILSSFRNRPISYDTIFIGEVSLVGDVKEVSQLDQRLKEASSYNFKKAIVAKAIKGLGIKCFEADEVNKVIDWM